MEIVTVTVLQYFLSFSFDWDIHMDQILKTVWSDHIFKHLEARQKDPATCCIFNSLGVWEHGQT